MGLAPSRLRDVEGLSFFKLLGTGAEGFSTRPDWSVYGLLQVWEGEGFAEDFFEGHPQYRKYMQQSAEHIRLYMHPIRSRGNWDGGNPFEPALPPKQGISAVAVITRATIHRRHLRTFWKHVPASQHPLRKAEGLLYTKGIGETPFIDMATFSLWTDQQAMMSYAYGTEAHQKVIQRTRELGWYREELFARFQPYRISGTWRDIPDLEAVIRTLNKGNTGL
jgi:hypothetical protein